MNSATRGFKIGDATIDGRVLTAPMTGVSDLPFRRAASKLGAPYVATEMVACELLARGRPDAVRRAAVGEGLPLMVIQLVGREAAWLAKGAAMAEAAGAHIIDLNMGCPAKEVTGGLSGSALMRDLDQAERLISAAVNATTRPVTLKMRLGWDDATRNAPALAARAEAAGIKAITVHGRTRQQFFRGAADWRAVAEVKAATTLPVIVNGDVIDVVSARAALEQSGADAIMIGRGVYGRPWLAAALDRALRTGRALQTERSGETACASESGRANGGGRAIGIVRASETDGELAEPDLAQRLAIVLDHMAASLRFYGDALGLKVFRKHLGWYVEHAPWPLDAGARRAAKATLCRLERAREVEAALIDLWGVERPARSISAAR